MTKVPPSATRSASSDSGTRARHRRHHRGHGRRRPQRPGRAHPGGCEPRPGRADHVRRLAPPDRRGGAAEPRRDPLRRQPVLRAAQLGVGAGAAAQLRRQVGPLPVGGGLRRAGQAAPSRHLDRVTGASRAVGRVDRRSGGVGERAARSGSRTRRRWSAATPTGGMVRLPSQVTTCTPSRSMSSPQTACAARCQERSLPVMLSPSRRAMARWIPGRPVPPGHRGRRPEPPSRSSRAPSVGRHRRRRHRDR